MSLDICLDIENKFNNQTKSVFWGNITHNLNTMANEAGIYYLMWRPDEIGITKAHQLITPLSKRLEFLKSNKEWFEEFNPSNGWGDYDQLVTFVEKYLNACQFFPDANIYVSR